MILSPFPKLAFLANNGRPLDGGLLFTYAAGTTTKIATYLDDTGGSTNTNPIVLDFRGEANVWLDPSVTYKFALSPPGDTDPPTRPIWTVDNISVLGTQQDIGRILYPRTAAEITAGVTPTYYFYPPYDYRRYGAVADGTTDNTALMLAVNAAFGASFSGVFYVAPDVLYDFNAVMAAVGGARYVLRDESLINAHNTAGFRQKVVGWSEGGDPTSVNDLAIRISSGHNACLIMDNRGTSLSSSGNLGIAMRQWTRGELDIGQPDPRDLARDEYSQVPGEDRWWWIIRRAAPWSARTWEYWEQGQVISATGIYRRTVTGYYVSASTGTTGATEPNWLTGTSSDGGVDWTTVLPNVDSGIFAVDQWGQVATNRGPVTAVGLYSKADKYSPGTGQNDWYLAAAGVSKTVSIRLFPTDGAEAETALPYLQGNASLGVRLLNSGATQAGFVGTDARMFELAQSGLAEIAAADGDATPSVGSAGRLILRNTGATNITFLDDGTSTQRVELFFENGNTTLIHNAGTFLLRGGVNVTPAVFQVIYMERYSGSGAWFETGRNF
jgi:hypothetical protein